MTSPTPTPNSEGFPPSAPTTLTKTIPSYLYQEYADDADLQAFIAAFNSLAQDYVTWFATVGLPAYTGGLISGQLLDWVAQGLYGQLRPELLIGSQNLPGPLNTYQTDSLAFNAFRRSASNLPAPTTDDIFKRIITWNFYKGDGMVFDIRWLKRRVMRFLLGTSGTAPNVDQTYPVSVSFGFNSQIIIRISAAMRIVIGGAQFNRSRTNSFAFNSIVSKLGPQPYQYPLTPALKAALQNGVLQLPFQFNYVVIT